MSRVQEIEQAIEQLSADEFAEVARWVQEIQQSRWDEQLDRDAASGRLDFLREEAKAERHRLKEWP